MKLKRKLAAVLVVLLFASIFMPVGAYASMADDAVDYEFGHTYSWYASAYYVRYYHFALTEKSNVFIQCTSLGKLGITVYDSSGKSLMDTNDFPTSYNSVSEKTTYKSARILPKGNYYVKINGNYDNSYLSTFYATAETAISLTQPRFTSFTNSGSQKMTLKYTAIKNRTGYQVQYALKSNFSGAKTVRLYGTTKTISDLTKGKTYYIRVRAYAIYGSGNYVYSAWSPVRTVKISK